METDPNIEFGISLKELKKLMEKKNFAFKVELDDQYGGIQGLAQKLRTNLKTGLSIGDDTAKRVKIFGKNEMFGGVPVIVLGDLYQVSPVAGEMIFTQAVQIGKKANAYQVVASGNTDNNYLWARFELYEMTKLVQFHFGNI